MDLSKANGIPRLDTFRQQTVYRASLDAALKAGISPSPVCRARFMFPPNVPLHSVGDFARSVLSSAYLSLVKEVRSIGEDIADGELSIEDGPTDANTGACGFVLVWTSNAAKAEQAKAAESKSAVVAP